MDVFDTGHQGMEYQQQPLWGCRPHVVVVVDDRSKKATATPGAWRRGPWPAISCQVAK